MNVFHFPFSVFRKTPRRRVGLGSYRNTEHGTRNTIIAAVFLAFTTSVHAGPLAIELVSEVTTVQPGTPFHVGLHLKHREHYHTYWKFPGIVGVPTDMAWELPPGWKAGPIEWPAPERVMMFRIKAQGYHGEVLLPMKITPPQNLEQGAKITLKGKASWMCCGMDCNPGFEDLSLTLPVDKVPASPDMRSKESFAKARAAMPQPLAGFDARASRDREKVILRLTPKPGNVASVKIKASTGPQSPGIFFTEDGYINADKDQVFRHEGDALVIELSISTYFTDAPPDELRGILWLKDGSLGKGAIIRVPFSK